MKYLNNTYLTIVVSAIQDIHAPTATLLKPKRTPNVVAQSGRTVKYHLPLVITVNSIFVRSLVDKHTCVKGDAFIPGLPMGKQFRQQCSRRIRINIPLNVIAPGEVESTAIDNDSEHVVETSGASREIQMSRLSPEEFYNAQTQIDPGEAVRMRRNKRYDNVGPYDRYADRPRRANPLFSD